MKKWLIILVLLLSGDTLAQGIPMVASQAKAAPTPRPAAAPVARPAPAARPAARPSSCAVRRPSSHHRPRTVRPHVSSYRRNPYRGYGYQGYGYQGYALATPQSYQVPTRRAFTSSVERGSAPAQPDPRSRLAHKFRATIHDFVRSNSLAGAFLLKDPRANASWLLDYAGAFRYDWTPGALSVVVPFRGRLGSDPREHRVDVRFRFASDSFDPQLLGADIVAVDGFPR
ncbi:MAG: hypothetical protein AB7S38_34990 [Vulcanimicrobiota bacterium]